MGMLQREAEEPLLSASDPAPFDVVNPVGASDICLVCEHAGRAVPARLGDLGVAAGEMDRHIAYDVGAEALARRLSTRLDAPLALQRYSRLVVDPNRPFEALDCILPVSDGTRVPANANLSKVERGRRWEEIHQAFHRAVEALLDDHAATHARTHLVRCTPSPPCWQGSPAHVVWACSSIATTGWPTRSARTYRPSCGLR